MGKGSVCAAGWLPQVPGTLPKGLIGNKKATLPEAGRVVAGVQSNPIASEVRVAPEARWGERHYKAQRLNNTNGRAI
jgi:hypothetical protein